MMSPENLVLFGFLESRLLQQCVVIFQRGSEAACPWLLVLLLLVIKQSLELPSGDF